MVRMQLDAFEIELSSSCGPGPIVRLRGIQASSRLRTEASHVGYRREAAETPSGKDFNGPVQAPTHGRTINLVVASELNPVRPDAWWSKFFQLRLPWFKAMI